MFLTNYIRSIILKNVWTLQRFGFTPHKLIGRINRYVTNNKIVCICIPKSGTHLLERALCLHPDLYRIFTRTIHEYNYKDFGGLEYLFSSLKPNQILITHLYYSNERLKMIQNYSIKGIFMIRDPRDIVVSDMFYIKRRKDHKLHKLFMNIEDQATCLKHVILGMENYQSIIYRLENFQGWLESGSHVVRYEHLIGAVGGGNDNIQMSTLKNIFEFLNIDFHTNELHILRDKIFSEVSPTFRKGTTGGWKNIFTPEIKDIFKQHVGKLLIKYGYEKDNNW